MPVVHATATATGQDTRVPLSANQAGRVALATGPDGWLKPPCHFGFWIQGPIDPGLVARTLTIIMRRHTALRYAFDGRPDTALCRAPSGVHWPLKVVDLRGPATATREDRLRAELAELRTPFALGDTPLARAVLVRHEESRSLLGIAVDHIVFDGGSVSPFLRDFESLYQSLAEGVQSASMRPGSDFADFAAREQRWLASGDGRESIRHWAGRWPRRGPFQPIPLPAPGDEPAGVPPAGTWSRDIAPEALDAARRSAGAPRGAGPLCMVTAALVTAARSVHPSAGYGLVFPFSRRVWPGTRHGIGYYNNRLFLSVPEGAPDFSSAVQGVQEELAHALNHGMVPFELLLRRFSPEYYDRKPPGTYMFVNITTNPVAPRLPGARTDFTWLKPEPGQASVRGLTIDCEVRTDRSIHLSAAYSTRRYDRNVVEEVLGEAGRLLSPA
ncbi:condensation domain-containing protein [Sphaerisporangium sp. TRM90804]|uniref:condensation domain-containing protein n=1 Tax=Sphaerisporangium sp. TRM90804 TaxID=3031113 RepID=UPI002449E68F|nr:condensation domain-containing protein [Sphaerisporangium sp. TRM90804]MDH2424605.1 condensation domain-containing protein [Sphaerisporangium sp. TRM90804]